MLKKLNIYLLLALLFASAAFGQNYRSAVFSGSQEVSITVPNSAPYNALTDSRIEFRVKAWSGSKRLGNLGSLLINTTSTTLSVTDFYDGSSPTETVTLDPTLDYLVRIQRQVTLTAPSTQRFFTMEVWTADGTPMLLQQGSSAQYGVVNVTTPVSYAGTALVGGSGGANFLTGNLAWFRWYSTVVGLGTQAPSNVPGGDLLDLEFEGNVTDGSAHALATSVTSGSLTYSTTPLVPLFVYSSLSTRASVASTLDASPTNAATYFWQQIAGPDQCTISSRTVANPTITNCVLFGQHDFQVRVTDVTGASATSTVALGAVPTNSSGVVVVSDAGINFKLGPLYRYGLTPWTWYDLQQFQMSNYWYGDPANNRGSRLCQDQQSGCLWLTNMTPGSDPSINYYDAVLANYQMYYRTGLTAFQTRARALALQFWNVYWNTGSPAGGCNSNWAQPRQGSAGGLLIYEAETGDTSMYSCIDQWIFFELTQYVLNESTTSIPPFTSFANGSREPGYAYLYATMEAQRDPTNATYHWLTNITAGFNGVWLPFPCPNSPVNYTCSSNTTTSQPNGTVTATNSSTSVVGVSTNFTILSHGDTVWFNDSSAGWNSVLVNVVTDDTHMTIQSAYTHTATSAAAWANAGTITISHLGTAVVGLGTNFVGLVNGQRVWFQDGVGGWNWFLVNTVTDATHMSIQSAYPWSNSSGVLWTKDITRTSPAGSYPWVDPAWNGYGEQAWHTSIAMEGIINYHKLTGDANAITVMKNWADATTVNQLLTDLCTGVSGATKNFITYQNYSGLPEGNGCNDVDGLTNSRSQNNTVSHVYGYLFLAGQGSTYQTTGNLIFSADYGYLYGPGADQYNGLAASTANSGKEFGQAFRSSGHYLAYNTGTTPAVTPLTLYVGAKLSSIPTAAKYRVTITAPSGAVTTNTCTTSPCAVNADSQQGNSLELIEYLTSGNALITSTSRMIAFVTGSGGAPIHLYLSTLTNGQLLTMTDSQLLAMTNPALSWNYLTSSQWSTLTSAQWSALTQ